MRFDTDLGGRLRETVYELTDSEVIQRSQAGVHRIAVDQIASVKLNEFFGLGICELRSKSGSVLNISSGRPDRAREYVDFIEAVHSRLPGGAKCASGSWLIVGLFTGIALLLIGVGTLMLTGMIVVPPHFRIRGIAVMGMTALALVVAPLGIPALRPKPYHPQRIPSAMLPAWKQSIER